MNRVYSRLFILLLIIFSSAFLMQNREGFAPAARPPTARRLPPASSTLWPEIPKVIWTYCPDENKPAFVSQCIYSWKTYNPDYEVRILTDKNIESYVQSKDVNYAKLYLLNKFGGVWMDMTVLTTSKLTFQTKCQFSGYYSKTLTKDMTYPVIDTWFMASVQNSPFIAKCLEEFPAAKSVDDYINKNSVFVQNIPPVQDMVLHIVMQKVMQYNIALEDIKKFDLKAVEDGPLKYMFDNGFDSYAAVKSLCTSKQSSNVLLFMASEVETVESNVELFDCMDKLCGLKPIVPDPLPEVPSTKEMEEMNKIWMSPPSATIAPAPEANVAPPAPLFVKM